MTTPKIMWKPGHRSLGPTADLKKVKDFIETNLLSIVKLMKLPPVLMMELDTTIIVEHEIMGESPVQFTIFWNGKTFKIECWFADDGLLHENILEGKVEITKQATRKPKQRREP